MLPICHKDSTLGIEAHVCAKCFLMMDFCLWFENFMNVSVHSYLKLKNCYFILCRSPKGRDKDFVQWFVEDYCKDITTSQEVSIMYICSDFWKKMLPIHCLNLLLSQDGDVCGVFLNKQII